MLPKIKSNFYLPEDEEILRRVEGIIRELLSKEQNSPTRQLIQTYACELSRTETRSKSDKSDELKQKAEDEIWSKKEAVSEVPEKPKVDTSEEHLNDTEEDVNRLEKGSWRTHIQHPKTAVVRPQPQVVVTQRSPSPMPRSFRTTVEERKSRLPLSTSQNSRFPNIKHKTTTSIASIAATPSTGVRNTLPPAIRRSSTEVKAKSRLSSSRKNVTTLVSKPPTGLSADKTNVSSLKANRPPIAPVMSRSVSSLGGKGGLMPSQSTDSVMSFGQGLIKVRSFSNIARTPTHLSMKVKSIN
uniref:Nbl1_Borealin_N domain-containing protein n=1 Tax=Elaeophora elaphi TaxID=1147741 RepID=A0A0R3RM32_9BILA